MANTEEEKSGLASLSTNALALIGSLIASPFAVYFYYRGDSGRALVSLVAGVALMIVISVRWNLRRLRWFWITIAIVVAINIALIVLVPWPSGRGIHGPVLAPFGAALVGIDYLAVWIALKIMKPRA